MKLSVSILNAKDKKETTKLLNNTDISNIHIDVMDGLFVNNTNFTLEEIREISSVSEKKLDVHLMTVDPLKYIEGLKDLSNIEYITIHLEIDKDVKSILTKIREYGFKAGLSIKPNTDIKDLLPYLDYIDLILVMTVEPGLGGQSFIEGSDNRLLEIKNLVDRDNILYEVDGGINKDTISKVSSSDLIVVGSYITNSDDINSRINSLLV